MPTLAKSLAYFCAANAFDRSISIRSNTEIQHRVQVVEEERVAASYCTCTCDVCNSRSYIPAFTREFKELSYLDDWKLEILLMNFAVLIILLCCISIFDLEKFDQI